MTDKSKKFDKSDTFASVTDRSYRPPRIEKKEDIASSIKPKWEKKDSFEKKDFTKGPRKLEKKDDFATLVQKRMDGEGMPMVEQKTIDAKMTKIVNKFMMNSKF